MSEMWLRSGLAIKIEDEEKIDKICKLFADRERLEDSSRESVIDYFMSKDSLFAWVPHQDVEGSFGLIYLFEDCALEAYFEFYANLDEIESLSQDLLAIDRELFLDELDKVKAFCVGWYNGVDCIFGFDT